MVHRTLATLLHTVQDDKLFLSDDVVVLGVSGGADSLVLLHACWSVQVELGITLHVATFDHMLRGADGAADVAFVQRYAAELSLACTAGQADVQHLAQTQRISIEMAARRARYDFLAEVAQAQGAGLVATAHHADDQAETILMHIIRGSGLQGLTGMATKSPLPYHPTLTLVRPLLRISRAEIEQYCEAFALQPRQDLTNQDTSYERNAIRHELLPHLERFNPQIKEALNRLGQIATTDQAYIEQQFEAQVRPLMMEEGHRYRIAQSVFRAWHGALQARALRHAVTQLGADASYEHVQQALAIIQRGQVGTQAQFPNGVHVRVGYQEIFIERNEMLLPALNFWLMQGQSITIDFNKATIIHNWVLMASTLKIDSANACLYIPQDAEVRLRTRRPGDRIQPQGLEGKSQKLKKWLIDHKVPQNIRDNLPILTIDEKIAAVILPERWLIGHSFTENQPKMRKIWFEVKKLL